MNFKFSLSISSLCLLLMCCSAHTPENKTEVSTQTPINPTTTIPTKEIIDTNLTFGSLEAVYDYQRTSQKKVLTICDKLKDSANNGKYLADSIYAHFQESFLVLLYKNLQHLPKERKEFHALYSLFELSTLLDDAKKKALFMQFPENLRNSAEGKKTLSILAQKSNHINKAITAYPDLPLTDADNNKIQLFDLLRTKKMKLIVLGATWCAPCSYEDQKIYIGITNKKIDTNKVQIIHISIDENRKKWVESLKKPPFWSYTYNCANGLSAKFFTSLQVMGVPHYILINEENLIIIEGRNIEAILPYIK